jgi:hypothetical protein
MKKIRKIFFVVFIVFSGQVAHGQKEDDNKYMLTILDGERFRSLFDFIVSQKETEHSRDSSQVLFERKLIEDSLEIGIYKFGIAGSHQVPFLYFKSKNGKKKFIQTYELVFFLRELENFFKNDGVKIKEEVKIQYLKEIADFLNYRRLAEENRDLITR